MLTGRRWKSLSKKKKKHIKRSNKVLRNVIRQSAERVTFTVTIKTSQLVVK